MDTCKNDDNKKMKLDSLSTGTRCDYPISELIHPEYNPRKISSEAMSGLRASVKRWGIVQEVVVNKRNGHIVGGNQRLEAAISEGMDSVPVFIVDLDDTEEKALNVALNNPHIAGEFTEGLQVILDELKIDLGFSNIRLDALEEEFGEPVILKPLLEFERPPRHGAYSESPNVPVTMGDIMTHIDHETYEKLHSYLKDHFDIESEISYQNLLEVIIDNGLKMLDN